MLNDDGEILAYFSLTFKEVSLVHSDISKGKIKRLDGINKNAEKIKAYLIGQIGKNFSVESNKITLELILDEVYAIINEAKALVGGRAVILECDKNPKLIELYKKNGFDELIHTPHEPLVTMYTYIA
ncbi:acetyltransferase [Vibrio vulnificus]|nr:acetyltransferase [Vibrio vulnificus]EGQ8088924.1 acetyltransferase [Vibrio vulnificus]